MTELPPLPPPSAGGRWIMEAPAASLRSTRGQRVALLLGLLIALWLALQLFASVLLPFVAAAGIAYFLDPLATRLSRAHVPRGAAALLLIIGLIAAGLLFLLLLYPLILAQLVLLVGRVPSYALSVQAWLRDVLTHLQESLGPEYVNTKLRDLVTGQAGAIVSFLVSSVSSVLFSVIGSGVALFNVLALAIVTPIVAFYLLKDWPQVIGQIDSWLPRRYAGVLRAQAHEVDRILSAWVRGQALCCLILALYFSLALTVVGLDLGLIVGLVAGALSFIPYVGTVTAFVTALGLSLAQFPDWHGVLLVAAVLVLGQVLEGYVIYPRFLGDRVELGSVWVIFALFAGGAAFGFLGVMLAVPVAATIGVLARFWLRRYLESPLYLDPPAVDGRRGDGAASDRNVSIS
jgi:predicted PurR-regulated permease PerM